MNPKTEELERDILRVFKCACRLSRPDIAEFMLRALEKLDQEQLETSSFSRRRALLDAYLEIAIQPASTEDAV
ncbi:MAG: hypothetical protein JNK47_24860 [Mesorhizobium sp.]|nr:hypothetical protein [Mesorhizobium sp.]MBL8580438.1 hypothetical protein [Mesorhizobium sp.]